MNDVHLSVVATSRNDDHGGRLTHRMQNFVAGLVAQCRRHGVRAELVLVEWNPPPERRPLIEEIAWPRDRGGCDIRIVTVPAEVHRTFDNADRIRLYQMIAKNVGIRRARGKYVVATNVDILFSDEAMRFMRDRLRPGTLYLADRADVPAELPESEDFAAVLAYCAGAQLRVNAGALTLTRGDAGWRGLDRLKASVNPRLGYFINVAEQFWSLARKSGTNPRWAQRRLVGRGFEARVRQGTQGRARSAAGLMALGALRVLKVAAAGVARAVRTPTTNACGDFTLMARADWEKVRGYVEWPVFSWHLDTLLVYQAMAIGVRIRRLRPAARAFHIEHEGGYAPERAAEMFRSLRSRGIPFITDEDLSRIRADLMAKRQRGESAPLNPPGWGLADARLAEGRP